MMKTSHYFYEYYLFFGKCQNSKDTYVHWDPIRWGIEVQICPKCWIFFLEDFWYWKYNCVVGEDCCTTTTTTTTTTSTSSTTTTTTTTPGNKSEMMWEDICFSWKKKINLKQKFNNKKFRDGNIPKKPHKQCILWMTNNSDMVF